MVFLFISIVVINGTETLLHLLMFKIYIGKESESIYLRYLSLKRPQYLTRIEYIFHISNKIVATLKKKKKISNPPCGWYILPRLEKVEVDPATRSLK